MSEESRTDRALVVVDMQNDFAHASGSLFVSGAGAVIAGVNREIRRAAGAAALIAYSQDWHPESTPHFAKDGGVWPVHCVAESWGAELHQDVMFAQGAHLVRKGVGGEDGYSAFSVRDPQSGEVERTGLHAILVDGGINAVTVVGLATDYCVKETVLDAIELGYETTVLLDCIAAVNLSPSDGADAIEAMRSAGANIVDTRC